MVYAVLAIAALFVVGYFISRINSNREAKKSVQTLFNTK
jgi:VIT1/CCC1 family predicted Fe2+/Mn2+ transporter